MTEAVNQTKPDVLGQAQVPEQKPITSEVPKTSTDMASKISRIRKLNGSPDETLKEIAGEQRVSSAQKEAAPGLTQEQVAQYLADINGVAEQALSTRNPNLLQSAVDRLPQDPDLRKRVTDALRAKGIAASPKNESTTQSFGQKDSAMADRDPDKNPNQQMLDRIAYYADNVVEDNGSQKTLKDEIARLVASGAVSRTQVDAILTERGLRTPTILETDQSQVGQLQEKDRVGMVGSLSKLADEAIVTRDSKKLQAAINSLPSDPQVRERVMAMLRLKGIPLRT